MSAALIALMFFTLVLIGRECIALGMDWYLSVRYWYYAIPSYFSELHYGAPRYTYFLDVAVHFSHAHPFETRAQFQPLLDAAASGITLVERGVHLFPADEKGTVDFVRLAFAAFGVRIESIFYLYSAIFAASLTLFAIRFRNDVQVLLVGVFAMAALYVGIAAFPITKEVYSVTNPRAIGSLAFIPLLHLQFMTLGAQRMTRWHVVGMVFQAAVLVLVVSIRTSELWQVMALGMVTAGLAAQGLWSGRRSVNAWPVGAVVAILVGYAAYQTYLFPPGYFETNLRNKIFWHNVLIGLSLSPAIADRYKLDVSDTSVLAFVTAKTAASPDKRAAIFWNNGERRDGMVKDFRAYEELCRQSVRDIVVAHPLDAALLLLWYKPRQLLRSLEYATTNPVQELGYFGLADQAGSLLGPDERGKRGAYFAPWSPVALGIVLAAWLAAGAARVRTAFRTRTLVVLGVVLASSTIPGMVTYPVLHVVAAVYSALALWSYAAASRAMAAWYLTERART